MSFPAPPAPAFPPEQSTVSQATLRYEDVAQDGRLVPIAIPPALGGLWRMVIARHPGTRAAIAKGVVPILTRMTIVSHDQPIRVDHDLEVRSGFELAQLQERGEVQRLFMLIWSEVHGVAGRIGGMRGREPGTLVPAGRLFCEYTFTRPFAPPDQRRVTRLDVDGFPAVPEATYAMPPPASAAEAPVGSTWLDELAPDPVETVLSLDQTDSNQHVNSLVYIRLFLDAVWRRLATTGRSAKLRSRAVDIAYRKPCFAGEQVRPHLRLFDGPDGPGAAGHVVGADGKPRCYVRVLVSP